MSSQEMPKEMAQKAISITENPRQWFAENKLRAVGLFWATTVGGCLAFQWTRPIPTSLKIIHSRVYAQAFTLAALGLVAVVDVYEHRHQTNQDMTLFEAKLKELEERIHATIVGSKD